MSLLLVLLSTFSAGLGPAHAPLANACHSANSWSSNEITYLQGIVTGTDAGNAKLRQAFDLPYVTTTPAVELVTDEAECANAVTAVNSLYTDGRSHSPVFLIRVGSTRYAISDGSDVHIFDTSYSYKMTIGELD
jgi:hypothetical protein